MAASKGAAKGMGKRLHRAFTALDAIASHPAATPEDIAAVQRAKNALFPVYVRVNISLTGQRLTNALAALAEWLRKNGKLLQGDQQ